MKNISKSSKLTIVITLVLMGILAQFLLLRPKPTVTLRDRAISVVIPKKYETEIYEERHYVYIPINSDMSQFSAKVYLNDKTDLKDESVQNYFRNLDTLIPGERIETFSFGKHEITLYIIVE
ncbi:MAG: hypothetical protein GX038_02225 [Erysipelothrix sp.]|nr:hypothetical protein [Erysipelothrix sp.]